MAQQQPFNPWVVPDTYTVYDFAPEDIRSSPSPWVHQFMWGEADGPVHFAYPASTSLQQDLGLKGNQHD